MIGERVRSSSLRGEPEAMSFRRKPWRRSCGSGASSRCCLPIRRGNAFGDEVAVRRIRGGAMAGQTPWGRIKSVAELAAGWVQAAWGLRRVSPRAVVGFGGYASVPTVLAAAATALPTIIHEQNAVLGRANRLLAKRAGRIATAFETISGLPRGVEHKVVRTGMPVRPSFARLRIVAISLPKAWARSGCWFLAEAKGREYSARSFRRRSTA